MAQAAVLKPGQHRHLLRVTKATSRDPEPDILVLLLSASTLGCECLRSRRSRSAMYCFPPG